MMADLAQGIVDTLKVAGILVAAGSSVAYACGYLVMRARAYALGTDPGFSFIDQAYVWAGIRFVLMLLLAMLISSPLLLLIRALWHVLVQLPPGRLAVIQWGVASVAGGAAVVSFALLLSVSNLVFEATRGAPLGLLSQAALQRSSVGPLMFIASTALTGTTLMWARALYARTNDVSDLIVVLLLASILLAVLLPLEFGFFFADRNVRRVDQVPEGLVGVRSPVWLIDRGAADRVVLLGWDQAGAARLVTIKAEKLEGMAITGVARLDAVIIRRAEQSNGTV